MDALVIESDNVFLDSSNHEQVNTIRKEYENVFINDKEFFDKAKEGDQFMILDIGCPRSLMGNSEFNKLKDAMSSQDRNEIKVYSAVYCVSSLFLYSLCSEYEHANILPKSL